MIDQVDDKWLEVIFPEDATAEDLFEFFKMNMTVSVNVNTKDLKTQKWIYKHKHWLKKGGE